jgi:hypothetical protein
MGINSHFHAPATLPPRKEPPVPFNKDWVDPVAGLDMVLIEKILYPLLGAYFRPFDLHLSNPSLNEADSFLITYM